jgi:hypothetical protein
VYFPVFSSALATAVYPLWTTCCQHSIAGHYQIYEQNERLFANTQNLARALDKKKPFTPKYNIAHGSFKKRNTQQRKKSKCYIQKK